MSLVSDEERNETMDFINILGYNIRYIKIGKVNSNETIILLHGIGGFCRTMVRIISFHR